MSTHAQTITPDSRNTVKMRAALEKARAALQEAADLVGVLRATVPSTLYFQKCVHPDALSAAETDYEEALSVYITCQQAAKSALKAERYAVK